MVDRWRSSAVAQSRGSSWRMWVLAGVAVVFLLLIERSSIWPTARTQVWSTTVPVQRSFQWWQQSFDRFGSTLDLWQHGAGRLAFLENEVVRLESELASAEQQLMDVTPLSTQSAQKRTQRTTTSWYGASTTWFVGSGCESGVRPNQAVLFQDALVGKVQRVFQGYSEVHTWRDLEWREQVRVGTDGPTGLLVNQSGGLVITELPARGEIVVDTPVFTVGSGIFAPQVLVGSVQEVQDQPIQGGKVALVTSLVQHEALRWVQIDTGSTTGKDICFESEYSSSADGDSGQSL